MIMVKLMPKWIVRILVASGLINLMTHMTQYFKLARRSVQDVVDELTDNADLKAVLAYACSELGQWFACLIILAVFSTL